MKEAYGDKADEMIEAMKSPGAQKSYKIMQDDLGVKLYGDESFEEIMEIRKTGKHPRGEPEEGLAYGGRAGFMAGALSNPLSLPNSFSSASSSGLSPGNVPKGKATPVVFKYSLNLGNASGLFSK